MKFVDEATIEVLAGKGGEFQTGIVVDDLFQIVRKAFVAILVHREDEGRRVERRIAELGVIGDQFRHLENTGDFPRNDRGVDHALRQRFRDRRNRPPTRIDTGGQVQPLIQRNRPLLRGGA